MYFLDIKQQHLVTDRVEVPNWRLSELPWLKRLWKRQVFRFRYLPKAMEVELRQRFGRERPLSEEEQLTLWKALRALEDKVLTAGDIQVLNHYQVKTDNADLTAALYAAVVVRPRFTPSRMKSFLEGLDRKDWESWVQTTSKYLYVTEEEQQAILNWSALRASRSSARNSMLQEGSSGGIGPGNSVRSDSSSSCQPSQSEGAKC